MTRIPLFMAVPALTLAACAGPSELRAAEPPAPSNLKMARRVADEPLSPRIALAQPVPRPDQRLPPPSRAVPRERHPPALRVQAANRAALREPSSQNYINATQVYAWTEGALYRLYTAPERVSDITLQAGETLISVAAGDTVRWVIGDTMSGSGAERRTHILVKPSAIGLRTNLVIATDRRLYHVQVESTARTAMASISWTYPQHELLALRRAQAGTSYGSAAQSVAVEALNFGYRIEGDDPPWRPLRAFDDGSQVFIEFPATLGRGEAPPLFVRGTRGRIELVNYRLRGRYYVVDRLFAAAELRLGERRQQVVRIFRREATKRRRGKAS